MAVYCAIPPLDQAATRVGRGYGLGYNRARTAVDQLHAGQDFIADAGTPVLAPLPGRVVLVSSDQNPARGMRGYGNAIVLEHDFAVAGLPRPFWTGYMHLRSPPTLAVGSRVNTGDLLGPVGNTSNRQFAGMGAHLHFEVRRRPYPGNYNADTVDPLVLWRGLGIDLIGARREVGRLVGGQLLVQEGGASDCRAGLTPTIAGLAELGLTPPGFIDPSAIRYKYQAKGVSKATEAPGKFMPEDYSKTAPPPPPAKGGEAEERNYWPLLAAGALGAVLYLRRSR